MKCEFAVVIPSFNPDERLIQLVEETRSLFDPIFIIVNDGSDTKANWIFDKLESIGCDVLPHSANRGKGAALKTAAHHITKFYPDIDGYITADADYQHNPEDIQKVAFALSANTDSIILGVRNFDGKDVPTKSKWGNRITSAVFYLQTGIKGLDTQTGLRGIPRKWIHRCEQIEGERYEYEMNVLLEMAKIGVRFVKVHIQTLYIEQNRSSHFRPVKDSALIYREIMKFSLSSFICAGIDLSLFSLFRAFIFQDSAAGIIFSTVAARLLSGTINFFINRNVVFQSKGELSRSWIKYAVLFTCNMFISGAATHFIALSGMPEFI
ncbi:MAG: bifunctional glycosyltransferase family 2/GtrA family protein, partial [Clostridiales bacterium]|nr:bifunctional glycosyltransferase family 2/GtrA family protein [Clostridiales bacterium]